MGSPYIMPPRPVRAISPQLPTELLDLRKASFWYFEVRNYTDQALTAKLIGSIQSNPAQAGEIGAETSVAADTIEPIVTDLFAPFLGVKVSFATAPTRGNVEIYAYAQEHDGHP